MSDFNLYGPVNNLGYGIVTRGIINSLLSKGISDFHLSLIGPNQIDNKEEAEKITNQIRTKMWDRNAPSVAVWHEFDLNKFSSKKLVAFPIFETTKFQDVALNYLKQMDAIFVLSSWAKEVVDENLNCSVPTFVVPGASNVLDTPEVNSIHKNDIFTFFTLGKLEKRKAHVETIKAYIDTFCDKKEDTRMICHCFNPFDSKFVQTASKVLNSIGMTVLTASTVNSCIIATKGNAIVEIPRTYLMQNQIFQLYRYSHIGVFPSRAEGWNLPLMEAIKMGTPCIASNYSAHTEYLNEEFNYPKELLLNNFSLETAHDGIFFKGDRGEWASPNMDELKETLLYTFNNYDKIVENFDNTKIKETFTWDNTTTAFMKALDAIK